MYVSKSLYDKRAREVALDDRQFFSLALSHAVKLAEKAELEGQSIDSKLLKESTPIIHCSSMSPREEGDEELSRTDVHSARARRKFLIADMDFNEGEEMLSDLAWEKAKALGERLQTPVMTYPTASWPKKPRWRLVMLSKRGLSKEAYWKAMTWLYAELGMEPTDRSDLNMSMNRNLPAFLNEEQAHSKLAFSTFDDESLQPLDTKLWSGVKSPKKRTAPKHASQAASAAGIDVDIDALISGCEELGRQKICASYDTYWRVSMSFAAAVAQGLISGSDGAACVRALASGAPDSFKKAQWEAGNEMMLARHLSELAEKGSEAMAMARPLQTYTELRGAFSHEE